MSSAAQVLANQANALLSTGPKSAEGKARSSRNAVKHGFARFFVAGPEGAAEFSQFEANLREAALPDGELEEAALLQFRDAAWRLEMLRAEVNAQFADQTQIDPLARDAFEKLAAPANRARAAAEMQLYRSLKALQDLQTTRLARLLHLTEEEKEQTPVSASPESFMTANIDGFPFTKSDRQIYIDTNGFTPPRDFMRSPPLLTP